MRRARGDPRLAPRRRRTSPAPSARPGFATDLFDATDVASCRMYRNAGEVWRGLAKNATEGLAAPGMIVPATVLLLAGQVMPPVLLVLALAGDVPAAVLIPAGIGAAAAWWPRLAAVRRFRQPLDGALLHPLAIVVFLVLQWTALAGKLLGRPARWKGRAYSSQSGPMKENRLRRIAVAGNAVALALLAMVLANAGVLLGGTDPPSNPHSLTPSPAGRGGKMLLVVVDALRNDSSLDPALMPNLTQLARDGGRGTARVESWIPSTVAGIRSIVEGRVPPPASFLQDFGASRSRDRGIFAVLKAAGRRSFAAGPRLWTDLYGPWLAGGAAEPAIGGDDGRLLRSGLDALAGGYDLVAVHLSDPDDAAHLHGGRSREYAAAVHRADAALGQLIARAGPGGTVLVTSDHGVTAQGGHAGPEPDVVTVPVVVRGPGLPSGDL